jgi:hypothetical protein
LEARELAWIGLLLTPTLCIALRDRAAWDWDPARVGRNGAELLAVLWGDPLSWPAQMLRQPGRWAPLPSWLAQVGVGLGLLVGEVDRCVRLGGVLAQGLALGFVGGAARALRPDSPNPARLAQLGLAASPLFVGLAGLPYAEPLLMALVAGIAWAAARAPLDSGAQTRSRLMLLGSLALLTKATAPLYAAAPLLWGVWKASPKPGRPGPLAWVALGLMALWYALHAADALDHLLSGAGRLAGWSRSGVWPGLAELVWVLGPLTLVFGLEAVAKRGMPLRAPSAWALIGGGAVILPLALMGNQEPRFLLPWLPLLLLAFAERTRSPVAVAVLGALQLLGLTVFALGLSPGLGGLHRLRPPETDIGAWGPAMAVADLACPPGSAGRVVVAVERPDLNANTVAFALVRSGDPSRRCPVEPAPASWGALLDDPPVVLVLSRPGSDPPQSDPGVEEARAAVAGWAAAAEASGQMVRLGEVEGGLHLWRIAP